MNRIPCLYAIVRFAPFVETGEFANTGVILIAPAQRVFIFKLAIKRHERITHFFKPLETKVFRATMHGLRDELERAKSGLVSHGFNEQSKEDNVGLATTLFNEIIRPRETVIKFSEPRPILASDPNIALDELYAHYVERNFVTREYQEAVLERGVRKWLHQARIAERFSRLDVGNHEYHATFPFVEKLDGVALAAIKPLQLDHAQASKILDHGGQWLFRIQALRKRGLLPQRVLFAVKSPVSNDTRASAAREIEESLRESGVTVLPYFAKEQILNFASTP